MEPSPQSVRQYMWKIWLWCGMITMRYDVTQLGVFCHMFFLGQGGTNKHAYWMQQSSLTHVAHLLKLQYIHNSSQKSCLIDQFCWIWLKKRTRNGLSMASLFFTKLFLKVIHFWGQIHNRLVIQCHCVCVITPSWFNKWVTYMRIFLQSKFSRWRSLIEP